MIYAKVCSAFERAALASRRPACNLGLAKQAAFDPQRLRRLGILTPEELQDLERYEEELEQKRKRNLQNAIIALPVFGVGFPVLKHLLSQTGLTPGGPRPWNELPYGIAFYSLLQLPLSFAWYALGNWVDKQLTPIPPSLRRYT